MWQLILIIGIVFLLLEIFIPGMFFLNFSLAAFIVAIVSTITQDIVVLTIIFCLLSIIFIYTLRPLLLRYSENTPKTGMDAKYIGKSAIAIEEIDQNKGAISLYDERWQAVNVEEGIIEKGSRVEIVGYDSIIMKVKKID